MSIREIKEANYWIYQDFRHPVTERVVAFKCPRIGGYCHDGVCYDADELIDEGYTKVGVPYRKD